MLGSVPQWPCKNTHRLPHPCLTHTLHRRDYNTYPEIHGTAFCEASVPSGAHFPIAWWVRESVLSMRKLAFPEKLIYLRRCRTRAAYSRGPDGGTQGTLL